MKKRMIALLMSVLISGGLCTDMTVFAEDLNGGAGSSEELEGIYSGTCGENAEWKLENGILTFSGSGDVTYPSGSASWAEFGEQIREVVVEPGITNFYVTYFGNSNNLTKITLNEGLQSFHGGMFYGTAVKEITIPASVTAILHEEDDQPWPLFSSDILERVDVAPGNSVYSSVDGVLYNKDKTEMIYYPVAREGKFEVPNGVVDLNSAFSKSKLSEIILPDSLKNLGSGFYLCRNLENIVIPQNVNVENIEWYCYAISGCDSLKSITFLSKTCNFDEGERLSKELVIYGYSGSTAEEMAKKSGCKFVALDAENRQPETMKVKVKGIKISGESKKIAAGKKIKLTASVQPDNAADKTVTWKSGNTKVATVNSSGVVTMKKGSGGKSVVITATAKDGSGVKGTYKITSMKGAVKSIKISGKTSIKAGKSVKLKAKVKADKKANTKLKWTSSNTNSAKVSSTGKVTARKAGKGKKVKITAAATDGSKKKKSITVNIR